MKTSKHFLWALSLSFLLWGSVVHATVESEVWTARILKKAGMKDGFCVLLGDVDPRRATAFARGRNILVQALMQSWPEIKRARAVVCSENLYGQVTIDRASLSELPYVDNLVNLLVIGNFPKQLKAGLSLAEVIRVTCPEGWVHFGRTSERELRQALARAKVSDQSYQVIASPGGGVLISKQRPSEMDEWTHFGYDHTNSRVSHDKMIGPLDGINWVFGMTRGVGLHPYGKHGTRSMISAGGRVYYITFNDVLNHKVRGHHMPENPYLVARDAFNGLRLWAIRFPTNFKRLSVEDARKERNINRFWRQYYESYRDLLVARGNELYTVLGDRIVVLDGATGRELRELGKITVPPNGWAQLILHKDKLIARDEERLCVMNASDGEVIWEKKGRARWLNSIAIGEGRMFAIVKRKLVAWDFETGAEVWKQSVRGENVCYNRGLLGVFGGKRTISFKVIDAKDGRQLWETKSSRENAFFNGDLLWTNEVKSRKEEFFVGYDRRTGEERKRFKASGTTGCFRNLGLEGYFVTTRPLRLLNLTDGKENVFGGARHICRVGIVPANGLIYTAPQTCTCVQAAMRSFEGVASVQKNEKPVLPGTAPSRLEKGPAYGQAPPGMASASEEDWPTFRHDPSRTSAVPKPLASDLALLWEQGATSSNVHKMSMTEILRSSWAGNAINPSGREALTQPVVAGGMVFVSTIDTHRVIAMEAATGRKLWEFTAGGRLDTPPTIHKGFCLFGAADGWVYCLQAKTGELVWRYLAAPNDTRIMAYGQIESRCPVVGGVLVNEKGIAHCVTGRTVKLKGGVVIHRLDVASGKYLGEEKSLGKYINKSNFLMKNSAGKIVVSAARDRLAERGWQLPARLAWRFEFLGNPPSPALSWMEQPVRSRRQSRSILVDIDKKGGSFWTRGAGTPEPKCLALVRTNIGWQSEKVSFEGSLDSLLIGWQGEDITKPSWALTVPHPYQLETVVMTGDVVWAGGVADRFKPGGKGLLWAVSMQDGTKLKEIKLPCAPVSEGLAVARGKLFVATRDGRVQCWGK